MKTIYKGRGKDRHSTMSYRGIYLLNTLTRLLEGLIEARLSKFTQLTDTLTPSQQNSRISRQTHDGIYALIDTINIYVYIYATPVAATPRDSRLQSG